MTKIDTTPRSLISAPAALSGRFIILVPDLASDYFPVIRGISELASARQADVLLLSLYKDAGQELRLRRDLIMLCALLQDGHVVAEMDIEMGSNWVDLVKRHYQPGDLIVCFAEPRAGFLYRRSQILPSNIKIPVYILAGPHLPKQKSQWPTEVMAWSSFLGIIIFFILQVNIVQGSKGGLQDLLLSLSILAEFWLLCVLSNWNQ